MLGKSKRKIEKDGMRFYRHPYFFRNIYIHYNAKVFKGKEKNMDFNEMKENLKTKFDETVRVVDEKTKPARTWVADHKVLLIAVGLGVAHGVGCARAEKKGFKNGVSVGLGDRVIQEYNDKIVSNTINKIDQAGENGISYVDNDGREIIVKKVADIKKL